MKVLFYLEAFRQRKNLDQLGRLKTADAAATGAEYSDPWTHT
jgi:hypothetical protein